METLNLVIFAQRLKKLRESKNLSTRALGEIVGMSNATISRYETGMRDPDLLTVYKMAQYFGVPLSYMCGEDINTDNEDLLSLYTKLSEDNKKEAIKYITYLLEKNNE